MPGGLHRTYGAHHLHFITTSCYRRLPFLRTARSRDTFLAILEQTRERYRFYLLDQGGHVRVNEGWTKISFRDRAA
jgi:REP element-mobilizing transposase RayT